MKRLAEKSPEEIKEIEAARVAEPTKKLKELIGEPEAEQLEPQEQAEQPAVTETKPEYYEFIQEFLSQADKLLEVFDGMGDLALDDYEHHKELAIKHWGIDEKRLNDIYDLYLDSYYNLEDITKILRGRYQDTYLHNDRERDGEECEESTPDEPATIPEVIPEVPAVTDEQLAAKMLANLAKYKASKVATSGE